MGFLAHRATIDSLTLLLKANENRNKQGTTTSMRTKANCKEQEQIKSL